MLDEAAASSIRALVASEGPSRKAVQNVAKKHGVKANQKTSVILEQLEALLKEESSKKPSSDASVVEREAQKKTEAPNAELEFLVRSEEWPVAELEPALDEAVEPMDVDEDPTKMDRRKMLLDQRADRSVSKAQQRQKEKKNDIFKLNKHRPTQPPKISKPLTALN